MFPFIGGYVFGSRSLGKKMSAMAASDASAMVARHRNESFELHDRIDRLTLVVGAMWSLLEEQGYTGEDLIARMRELDAGDGAADGKISAGARPCRQCGAMVATGLPSCQFCGMANPDEDPLTAD